MDLRFRSCAFLCALLVGLAGPASAQEADAPVVVYLVRHAEKADDGTSDPALTAAGEARATALASLLRDAGLDAIHSTDYLRTQHTAGPVAEAVGGAVASYDPRHLDQFAAQLRATPGRHLVVGHSNTTPELVRHLGGDPGSPIAEDEYDRLYVVILVSSTPATTLVLRLPPG